MSIVSSISTSFPNIKTDSSPPLATDEQLLRFHSPQHVKNMNAAFKKSECSKKRLALDGDTNICPGTRLAAYRAAGAACAAVDAVLGGLARNAFVAIRPPGHHAEPNEAMGFCIFGNAGIAALHARAKHGLRRIAVVDWDVHHG